MTNETALWLPPGAARSGIETADKAADLLAISRSVIGIPPATQSVSPIGASFTLWVAQQADGFTQWGANPKQRDQELRNFFPTENLLASAIATVCARNAALSWKISGDDQTAQAAQEMLSNANFGAGWEDFLIKLSMDLYVCDTGAFVEFVREEDSPDAPVIGINNLDSIRSFPTGDPRFPVIYQDTRGNFHRMPWYSVVQLLEMPSAITPWYAGFFYRLQYGAVSRVLRAAQVLRSLAIYKDEKLSGRFMRALHLISGVSEDAVRDAMSKANLMADQAGLSRYMEPALVGSVDPRAEIKHDTIELAGLPDGFDEHQTIMDYILAISMGLLTDYQEFAPLPGGGLGTATQSETLHAKSRGRGPGLFQKLILRLINGHGAIPSNVIFEFDEPDLDAEEQKDRMAQNRAATRAQDILSGVLDVEAAREKALEDGDITQAMFDELVKRDEERKQENAAQAEAMAEQFATTPDATSPSATAPVEGETGKEPAGGAGNNSDSEQPPGASAGVKADDSLVTALDPEDYSEDFPLTMRAAGLAIMAEDTGRILMLQRALDDADPASGTWEMPGGHIDEEENPQDAAQREWSEETGLPLPEGEIVGQWDSPDGVYRGYVMRVPSEAVVPIHDGREAINPDDPDGDKTEALAWWDLGHLSDNPALRRELADNLAPVVNAIVGARVKMLEGFRESVEEASDANPKRFDTTRLTRERLDYEAEVGDEIAAGLGAALRVVRQSIGLKHELVEEDEPEPEDDASKAVIGMVKEIHRTEQGYLVIERPLREGEVPASAVYEIPRG